MSETKELKTCYEAKKRSCSTCCTTSQVYNTFSFGKCAPPCRVLLLLGRAQIPPALVLSFLGWTRGLRALSPACSGPTATSQYLQQSSRLGTAKLMERCSDGVGDQGAEDVL